MDDAFLVAEQMTAGLLHTLRLARAMAGVQRTVSLDGLADKVGFLCAKAMDLPAETGRELRPHLLALMAEVDAVAAALRSQIPPSPRQKADPCPSHPPPS